jgi:predicted  nucleic acid-binding Zn-ribbon protein
MNESKDAYLQRLKAKLDEWNADLDKLTAQAKQVDATMRIEIHKQIDSLREQRTALERKFEEIRQSGDAAWQDIKAGVDHAWSALSDAVKSARSKFQ